jgi:predicted Zn-dependent protease
MKKQWIAIGAMASLCWTVAAALLLPQGCATTKKAEQEKYQLSEDEQKKLLEYTAEQDIGRNMAGRLLAFYGNQDSQELLKYVNRVATYVASYGDYPDRRYMVEILNSESVNAFACPGGFILVTMGAIRHAQTEAELAAVLGHEAVHVGSKHMFNLLKSMDTEQLEKAAADSKQASMPEELQVRKRPEPTSNNAGALAARLLQGAAGGLNMLKAAQAGMSVILEQGLGAEKEYEADREGVKYAIRAGYEPSAMEDFLCRLQKAKAGDDVSEQRCRLNLKAEVKGGKNKTIMDKTHPPIPERVKNVRAVLAELNADEIIGAVGKKRFSKYQKLLAAKKKSTDS